MKIFVKIKCAYCGCESEKYIAYVKRAIKIGAPQYCDKKCAGLGRRDNKTIEQKRKEKSEYDKIYREANLELIKQKKHEHFKRTYNKEQAAIERKKKYPKHLEYLRTPEYRAWKKEYDVRYLAKKHFGEFADAAILLSEINKILDSKKIKIEQGLTNKTQKRKRKWKNYQQKA